MFPKEGKFLPDRGGSGTGGEGYASAIATALRQELGETHRAVKTIMKWTGANERTVKNWLAARNGPRGDHLIDLIRHSDAVLYASLELGGRTNSIATEKVLAIRHALAETVERIDQLLARDDRPIRL